jgi:hypothetical protein
MNEQLRRLHLLSIAGRKSGAMLDKVNAAYELALADSSHIPAYLEQLARADAVWKPRSNKNTKFAEALESTPEWMAQKENGDFITPATKIADESSRRGLIPPDKRNIDKQRRTLIALRHQRELAGALREDI